MRPGEWTLRSRRVVTPSGTRAADILIRGETIAALAAFEDPDREGVILDVGDWLVLPGLVDLHVHVQEPGPEDAEGFETATRAAAAGGMTTPGRPADPQPPGRRPSPGPSPPSSPRRSASSGLIAVSTAAWSPAMPREVEPLVDAGVLGIVAALGTRLGPESPRRPRRRDLREAMPRLARLGRPLVVQAGLDGAGTRPRRRPPGPGGSPAGTRRRGRSRRSGP